MAYEDIEDYFERYRDILEAEGIIVEDIMPTLPKAIEELWEPMMWSEALEAANDICVDYVDIHTIPLADYEKLAELLYDMYFPYVPKGMKSEMLTINPYLSKKEKWRRIVKIAKEWKKKLNKTKRIIKKAERKKRKRKGEEFDIIIYY